MYISNLAVVSGVSEWLQGETGAMKPKDHAELFQGSVQLLDLSKGFLNDIDNQLAGHGSVDDEDVRILLFTFSLPSTHAICVV